MLAICKENGFFFFFWGWWGGANYKEKVLSFKSLSDGVRENSKTPHFLEKTMYPFHFSRKGKRENGKHDVNLSPKNH